MTMPHVDCVIFLFGADHDLKKKDMSERQYVTGIYRMTTQLPTTSTVNNHRSHQMAFTTTLLLLFLGYLCTEESTVTKNASPEKFRSC